MSKHNSAERHESIYQELKEKSFNEAKDIRVSVIKRFLFALSIIKIIKAKL